MAHWFSLDLKLNLSCRSFGWLAFRYASAMIEMIEMIEK
jgi:hypothetical protein